MPSQSSRAHTARPAAYSTAQAAFDRSQTRGIQLGIVLVATSTTPTIAANDASSARIPLVLSEEA
jgi:hypothetical protein